MVFKKIISTSLSLFIGLSLQAIRIESDSMLTIKNYLDPAKKTLIVFDIDNTLAWSGQELGSDQWFSHMWKQKAAQGLTEDEIIKKLVPIYTAVINVIPMVAVESVTPALIAQLQKNDTVKTMALTSRSISIKNRTIEQLAELNISFSRNGLYDGELDLSDQFPAIYAHGIIFSSNNNKGSLLIEFLNRAGYKPDKIIFIDDKQKYINTVEHAAEAAGIEYVGIRYNHLDERVKNFNPAIAKEQLSVFYHDHPELSYPDLAFDN